jgi:NAD(P)-dependent dehydrogenase (short-subunit alcohol dehydrogenase family)
MKIIVITGSTRGIGLGLARSFLELGCGVVISGRSHETSQKIASELAEKFGREKVFACACDVNRFESVQNLWNESQKHFGQVDIWINNAGLAHSQQKISDLPAGTVYEVINTNLVGAVYGCQVAVKGMQAQGFGSLYNMEGLGSDGRKQKGLSVYGLSKYGLRYLDESLAKELQGGPVICGAISPGMVVTELLLVDREKDPAAWEQSKRIFNILADRVETVTPWIAQKVLENRKNGAQIKWLTTPKILYRFLFASILKRNVID